MIWVWVWLFFLPLVPVVAAFVGYPLCVILLARGFGKPLRRGGAGLTAAVCFSARNEAGRLAGKLENLLDLGPEDRVGEVLVVLDGCEDGSEEVAAKFLAGRSAWDRGRTRVFCFSEGKGKAAALNFLAGQASADVLVMVDVRQRVEGGAIGSLLSCFADEAVGVVSGELVLEGGGGGAALSSTGYWGYEKSIRRAESALGSVPGATGALYAIRRRLFRAIPEETLLDDVLIPMRAVMGGARCVFDPGARAFDRARESYQAEEVRKRRTLAGNWQLLGLEPGLLSPRRNPAWAAFFFHKVLRLPTPFFLLLSLMGLMGAAWMGRWWGLVGVGVVGVGCTGGALAHWRGGRGGGRVLGWLGAVWGMNGALVMAAVDAVRGRFNPRWASAEEAGGGG